MKYLRIVLSLALIPLGVLLGSLVLVGTGSGIIIGFVLGIALSYLFLTYGPGRKKSPFPTSYSLNHQYQIDGGVSQQTREAASAQEATRREGP